MDRKLFIPGPTDISQDVYEAMSKPMIGHRGKDFSVLFEETVDNLKKLMFTEERVYISTSSSTGLMEAAIRNCVKNKCLNVGNGAFSCKWHDITKANGKEADMLSLKWGEAPTAELIDEALSKDDYDALTLVHNETSTGVTAPLKEIAEVVRDHDVSFLLDTVSSMGGIKVEVDRWDIDVCLFGVQKAMALPSGLACCSVSEEALDKSRNVENRGYYFDFQIFEKYYKKKQTPTTAAISILRGLEYQLDKILNREGLENRFQRHKEMGELTRKWAEEKGFELLPEERYASNTVSCVKNTLDVDCESLQKRLYKRGYVFSNGYGKMKNNNFRIAHMGDRRPEELNEYLETINELAGL
ncbi:MAG: alanine--glyoxylate aminotransferase family protein [Candidatus Altiarchaeota archaeon]|nr:alanine--glyoxylate aminotransferase family protein [Candidatus Altiarchaeota archaeon]